MRYAALRPRRIAALVCLAALTGAGGCGGGLDPAEDCVRPTIAVLDFENRAPFPLQWNLGGGMRDILVDRLVATNRYHVIERPELDGVLKELQLQHSGATRKQNRAKLGRLKNVQYLVKGTLTDFGHVSTNRGGLSLSNLDILGGSNRAVMGVTLYVIEVESGEIVASRSLEESVRAGDVTVKAAYRDVAFGGSTFYRTPLGRATAKVIGRAVREVSETIASRPWTPKIALVRDDYRAVINGGRDRDIRVGQEFEVLEEGQPMYDPDTGDLIGHFAATAVGRLRITRVAPRYSVGKLIEGSIGDVAVGQQCREAPPRTAAK